MAISTFKRYELKFILSQQQLDALIPRLLPYMEPDRHCKNGEEYGIYNLYFDTPQNNVIRHSVSKPVYKEKLRLRSYALPVLPDSRVFLELKRKTEGVVNKRRAVLSYHEACEFLGCREIPPDADYIQKQILHEIDYYLGRCPVHPAVFISYFRKAYFSKDDPSLRITFDRNISTRRDHLSLEEGDGGIPLLQNSQYLMEIKITNAVPVWLADLLSEQKVYKTGFSKYGCEYQQHILSVTPAGVKCFSHQSPNVSIQSLRPNYTI